MLLAPAARLVLLPAALFLLLGAAGLPGGTLAADNDPAARLGEPSLKAALILSPSEEVPVAAQLDLFEQIASEHTDPRQSLARLRHVAQSRVAYLELFANPFRDPRQRRNAPRMSEEELVEQAATLLYHWMEGLRALDAAALEQQSGEAQDPDAAPSTRLDPVLARGLFDGGAVATALAELRQENQEKRDEEEHNGEAVEEENAEQGEDTPNGEEEEGE